MDKFSTFFAGLLVGAALMFGGLKYHIVRAEDGFHMVPKTTASLGSIYADVRLYTVDDWKENQDLMVDITKSGNDSLQEQAAKSALGNTFSSALEDWSGGTP